MQADYEDRHLSFVGDMPEIGDQAADLMLVDTALNDRGLVEWQGLRKLIITVPTVDLDAVQTTLLELASMTQEAQDLAVLLVSADTPFTMLRFLRAAEIDNVIALSTIRSAGFSENYGVAIESGAFKGLLAFAAFVLDENNAVTWARRAPSLAAGLPAESLQQALGLQPPATEESP